MKAGNYWRWLKTKLAAKGIQPVSDTRELKLVAPTVGARWTKTNISMQCV